MDKLFLLQAAVLFITLSTAQQPWPQTSSCPTEECNANYRAQLEEVNAQLKQAMEQVNQTLTEQKTLINKWKQCSGNEPTPQYTVEKVASLEPCLSSVGPGSDIQGVAQIDENILVICKKSNVMRVYDSTTFQQKPNVTLPITDPAKYPVYIVENRFQNAVYLAVDGPDATSGENFPGYDIYMADNTFNWQQLSTAEKNSLFNIFKLSVASNGEMMFANTTHILFPSGPTSFSWSVFFGKPPLNPVDNIQGLVETKNGSYLIFSEAKNYLIRVSAGGDYLANIAAGTVTPTNELIGKISDMEQGPDDLILLADSFKDRIVILDQVKNTMSALILRESGVNKPTDIWGPACLSYYPYTKLLVVGERQELSQFSTPQDQNSLKIFRLTKVDQPIN